MNPNYMIRSCAMSEYKAIPFVFSLAPLAYHVPMSPSRFAAFSPYQRVHSVDSGVHCFALLLCSISPINRRESIAIVCNMHYLPGAGYIQKRQVCDSSVRYLIQSFGNPSTRVSLVAADPIVV